MIVDDFNIKEIEKKWQNEWSDSKAFNVFNEDEKPKYYVLGMLPYPSGSLHVGHQRNYTITDAIARFKRQQGYSVLNPIGWDAFGLPAENAAILNNSNPKLWTEKNIANMKEQLKYSGFSYDWNREFATCSESYCKEEQQIFLRFFSNNLIYKNKSIINWDPVDNTVLANEQVINGKGWRSGAVIEKRKIEQWFFNMLHFADDLFDGLKDLSGWPEKVKIMQERWIERSYGALIHFLICENDYSIENLINVFTTKPESIFGASFIAISSYHEISDQILKIKNKDKKMKEVSDFILRLRIEAPNDREVGNLEKEGIYTYIDVKHPFTQEKLPLYIVNYVLPEYGTGAIYGCPAHDERDYEFAIKYNIKIKHVLFENDVSINLEKTTQKTILKNSGLFSFMRVKDAQEKIIKELEEKKYGHKDKSYKLHDWCISRQRYWGCPIPIIICKKCGNVPVSEKDLPIILPQDAEFNGNGNPLSNHPTWKYVKCPICGLDAERECDTLDTFFESSWYFIKYILGNDIAITSSNASELIDKWLPVDFYVGGIEHAVMHLLYSRAFLLALNKIGLVKTKEPFKNLLTQGMVCNATYKNFEGKNISSYIVEKKGEKFFCKDTGKEVKFCGIEKMSKSKLNGVDVDDIINKYGADTVRMFVMSDSPPEKDVSWSEEGVASMKKYISRIYKFANEYFIKDEYVTIERYIEFDLKSLNKNELDFLSLIHITIEKVTSSYNEYAFHKVIAFSREMMNEIAKNDSNINKELKISAFSIFLRLMNPIIPHITEECFNIIIKKSDYIPIYKTKWPEFLPELLESNTAEIAIQINGKTKFIINMKKNATKEDILNTSISKRPDLIRDKIIKREIFVQNKILNLII